MKKIFEIARWEFTEKIKRKSFAFSMLSVLSILFFASLLISFPHSGNKSVPIIVGLIDEADIFNPEYAEAIEQNASGQPEFIFVNFNAGRDGGKSIEKAKAALRKRQIDALIITSFDNDSGYAIYYRTEKERTELKNLLNKAVKSKRMLDLGLDEKFVKYALTDVEIKEVFLPLNQMSEEEISRRALASFSIILILLFVTLFSGGMFVRGLTEEKSNRIIELLLSSVSHKQLLYGKFLGISLLGIFQMIIFALFGKMIIQSESSNILSYNNLEWQIIFFAAGYFLYSAIFLGAGSLLSDEESANRMTGVISAFLLIPLILSLEIISSPNSPLSQFISYFPLTAPAVMLLKLNIFQPSIAEKAGALFSILLFTYLIIILSSKLFKFGTLSYGIRLTLKGIINFMKGK